MQIIHFKNREFFHSLIKLGIPIALQNLLSFSMSFSNTIMVGRLGDDAVSGVYMGNQIKTLLTVFICGVEGAILALCAQYHGEGEHDKIKKVIGIGVIFAGGVSILLTLVCLFFSSSVVGIFTNNMEIIDTGAEYLRILCLSFILFSITQVLISAMRSVESTKIGFTSSLTALTVNTLLGYTLVFGKLGFPKFGINGTAIATLCAHTAELILVLIYIIFIDKKLKIRTENLIFLFRIDKKLIAEFIKYGSPIILGQLLWGANMLFASALIGRQGKAAVTAMSVAGSLLNLSHIVTNGSAGALGIIIGKSLGEREYKTAKQNAIAAQPLFAILGVATSLFILLIKAPFISIYSISSEASREAGYFINVLAVITIGTCYQSATLNGILKSAKDTRFVFATEALTLIFAVFPLSLIAARLSLAPWMIFSFLKCDQFIKCIPAAIRTNRFKWVEKNKG